MNTVDNTTAESTELCRLVIAAAVSLCFVCFTNMSDNMPCEEEGVYIYHHTTPPLIHEIN